MEWQGSVPGKTFLFGEYAVLTGGPAVVLATAPRFALTAHRSSRGGNPFRVGSPASNLYLSQLEKLSGFSFEFTNPYGVGGFGASGAEFVLLARFLEEKFGLNYFPPPEASSAMAARTLDFFRSFERASKPSSGSDVLAQWLGGSIGYRPRRALQAIRWPFADLDFSIFSTGLKVATHDHVREVDPAGLDGLDVAADNASSAFALGDSAPFIAALGRWTDALARAGLTHSEALTHAKAFEACGALHARGCGALGADTILVLHRSDAGEKTRAFGQARGLKFQAGRAEMLEAQ